MLSNYERETLDDLGRQLDAEDPGLLIALACASGVLLTWRGLSRGALAGNCAH
ncbi:DUF3040 domain-containing protein [Pseudonocardia sp. Cha107L01]|jgi:hypothetical protein|uniref:DUF3040 domain-containing protein n=1 Tax=Pseudonocardia sp. Cha107L01 TaxID=3457576 RepID=UPI00403ED41E